MCVTDGYGSCGTYETVRCLAERWSLYDFLAWLAKRSPPPSAHRPTRWQDSGLKEVGVVLTKGGLRRAFSHAYPFTHQSYVHTKPAKSENAACMQKHSSTLVRVSVIRYGKHVWMESQIWCVFKFSQMSVDKVLGCCSSISSSVAVQLVVKGKRRK